MRKLLALAFAALVVVAGFGAPKAQADTPDGTTKAVVLKLLRNYSGENVGPYHTALIHLRQAAGRIYRDDVYITQAAPPGLVALRIHDAGDNELVSVYLNPANLYIGGFRSKSGQLFAFNDASENVRTEMGRGGQVNILNFGGSTGSLITAAGGEPTIESIDGLINSANNLGNTTNLATANGSQKAGIAAAMIKFSGAFSEAARFSDFRDQWDPVIAGRMGGSYFPIMTNSLGELSAAWGTISKFALDINDVPGTPPVTVDGVGKFSTWADVQNHLRVIRR